MGYFDPSAELARRERMRKMGILPYVNLPEPEISERPIVDEQKLMEGSLIKTPSSSERLRKIITEAPVREDYKPSKLRTILGAIAGGVAGAGGYTDTGRMIVNAPYDRAKRDWDTRYGKVKAEADLDTQMNDANAKRQQQAYENSIKGRTTSTGEMEAETGRMRAENEETPEQRMEHESAMSADDLFKSQMTNKSRADEAMMKRFDDQELEEMKARNAKDLREMSDTAAMARVNAQQAGANQRAKDAQKSRDKVLPTQQASAYKLAFTKTLEENPDLRELVDEKTEMIRTVDELDGWTSNPEEQKQIQLKLNKLINKIKANEKKIILQGGYGEAGNEEVIEGEETEAIPMEY